MLWLDQHRLSLTFSVLQVSQNRHVTNCTKTWRWAAILPSSSVSRIIFNVYHRWMKVLFSLKFTYQSLLGRLYADSSLLNTSEPTNVVSICDMRAEGHPKKSKRPLRCKSSLPSNVQRVRKSFTWCEDGSEIS